ncbi:uncharacterized protein LOC107052159 isoform X2 [Gallus gallus]|uniref:uncharacterized protein LOC107052159 isoform X2 n=1 Tax=Gallus gallus TaxID=9031 RepID=UPI001AE41CE3|nr:uncharacterized protein LOC107052159 isoform X2 [Gallus gallus]
MALLSLPCRGSSSPALRLAAPLPPQRTRQRRSEVAAGRAAGRAGPREPPHRSAELRTPRGGGGGRKERAPRSLSITPAVELCHRDGKSLPVYCGGDDVKATQMRLFLGVPGAESFRPDVQHPACPDRRLLSCSNLCSQVLRTSRWQKGSGSLPAQATSGKKQHRFQSVGPSRKGHAARAAGRQEAEESAHP